MTDELDELPPDNRFLSREMNGRELMLWARMARHDNEAMILFLIARRNPDMLTEEQILDAPATEIFRMMMECGQGVKLADKRSAAEVNMLAAMLRSMVAGAGVDSVIAIGPVIESAQTINMLRCTACGRTTNAMGFEGQRCGAPVRREPLSDKLTATTRSVACAGTLQRVQQGVQP